MIKRLLILSFLFPFLVYSQDKVRYKVYYDEDLQQSGLKVRIDYHLTTPSDTISFYYANENWGENNLLKNMIILKEDNPGISFEVSPEANRIKIFKEKDEKVSFVYRIKQDFTDPNYQIFNRPRINNHFFHILGKNLFIVPQSFTSGPDDQNFEFYIDWVNFPPQFKLHNNFFTQIRSQKIKTTLWNGFYNSLFIGGDYRFHTFKIKDKPVYFVIRDQWYNGFSDDFLVSNLKKAIQSQRDFWKDYDQQTFSVTMTPTVSQQDSLFKGYSSKGSAIKDAFMIQGTNNPFNSKDSYLYLLYHELMHEWIGNKIQTKNEELNFWFSEGFTDYYVYKNRLRIKDISTEEWLALFNQEIIKKHWKNPYRNIQNYTIKDDFWKDRNVEKVPYRRGAIFAFWLDNQILLKTGNKKSLDNLMLDLLKKCTGTKVQFTDEMFLDLAEGYLGSNISYFFQKHIISGQDIDLVNEKWIDGFNFISIDNIPQLQIDSNKTLQYLPGL
ncbi:M1 family aminopeptidase [Chryseobacterium sp.]|uniref:M1 family aminopeptidase n=1 Tax=Chryseobacterium sp. TaxID=1871047 RepID=UPI0025BC1034|nr:M1 family aminopeptidase [Chryseobacterium sp.]MBV8324912.1 peptidase [Chryseobacterium sp.]